MEAGQVLAVIEGEAGTTEVPATINGLLRGLIRDNYPVTKGFKIADIDPRKKNWRIVLRFLTKPAASQEVCWK